MAKDIAALSGGDKTAFKAALGGMGYMVPISAGAISSPVEYFDVALPSGYKKFRFEISSMLFSTFDSFALAFSVDGGTNFICDTDEFDSYHITEVDTNGSGLDYVDSLLALNGTHGDGVSILAAACFDIFPGSASDLAQAFGNWASYNAGSRQIWFGFNGIDPAATITPTPARVNLARFLPYGNGDCDPPTSGTTIISGKWALFGTPD